MRTAVLLLLLSVCAASQTPRPIVLHAARLLDVESGRMLTPGEVLIRGDRIVESGVSVSHPADAETIDLGDKTLMPGLIDAHIHLFLHPGAEDLQTVQESVPQRTIHRRAGGARRPDGGFHRGARHGDRRRRICRRRRPQCDR